MLRELDIKALIVELLSSDLYRKTIVDMNRRRLAETGKDVNGIQIRTNKAQSGNVYSNLTIAIKTEKGQRTDIVTAKDTGKLHDSIISTVDEAFIEITASQERLGLFFENVDITEDLLLGLTEENKEYLIEMLKRDLPDLILDNLTEEHLVDTDLLRYV